MRASDWPIRIHDVFAFCKTLLPRPLLASLHAILLPIWALLWMCCCVLRSHTAQCSSHCPPIRSPQRRCATLMRASDWPIRIHDVFAFCKTLLPRPLLASLHAILLPICALLWMCCCVLRSHTAQCSSHCPPIRSPQRRCATLMRASDWPIRIHDVFAFCKTLLPRPLLASLHAILLPI